MTSSAEKPVPPATSTVDAIEPSVRVAEATVEAKDATTVSLEKDEKDADKEESKAKFNNYFVRTSYQTIKGSMFLTFNLESVVLWKAL